MLQRFKEAHSAASASHNDDVAAQAAALIPPFAINRLGQAGSPRSGSWWRKRRRGETGPRDPGRRDAGPSRRGCWRCPSDVLRPRARRGGSFDRHHTPAAGSRRSADHPVGSKQGRLAGAAGRLDEALQTDIRSARATSNGCSGKIIRGSPWSRTTKARCSTCWADTRRRRSPTNARSSSSVKAAADADVLAWALTGLGRARLGKTTGAAQWRPSRRRSPFASRSTRTPELWARRVSRSRAPFGRTPGPKPRPGLGGRRARRLR